MVNLLNLPKAYVEVLEVLQFFPQKAYIKIPTEKIKFFERNKDKTYDIKLKSKETTKRNKNNCNTNYKRIYCYIKSKEKDRWYFKIKW